MTRHQHVPVIFPIDALLLDRSTFRSPWSREPRVTSIFTRASAVIVSWPMRPGRQVEVVHQNSK